MTSFAFGIAPRTIPTCFDGIGNEGNALNRRVETAVGRWDGPLVGIARDWMFRNSA